MVSGKAETVGAIALGETTVAMGVPIPQNISGNTHNFQMRPGPSTATTGKNTSGCNSWASLQQYWDEGSIRDSIFGGFVVCRVRVAWGGEGYTWCLSSVLRAFGEDSANIPYNDTSEGGWNHPVSRAVQIAVRMLQHFVCATAQCETCFPTRRGSLKGHPDGFGHELIALGYHLKHVSLAGGKFVDGRPEHSSFMSRPARRS